jgi:hypothetical protein
VAKLIVEIDASFNEKAHGMTFGEYVEKHKKDFFPTADKDMISVDACDLKTDPSDDSFYLFRLVRIEE